MALQNYEMNDLLLVVVGISGAMATLCLAIQKSKCSKISCLYGCFICDRDTKSIIDEEKLKLGIALTPRQEKEKLKLELNEPEVED